jgi:hypothetical protein
MSLFEHGLKHMFLRVESRQGYGFPGFSILIVLFSFSNPIDRNKSIVVSEKMSPWPCDKSKVSIDCAIG